MRFDIYIAAEGPAFDPDAFNRSLASDLRGEVEHRSYMRIRADGPQQRYWRSLALQTDDDPMPQLLALFERFESQLKPLVLRDEVKVSAQIVMRQSERESQRGLYVPAELIALLASLRADLDVDVVHDIG